MAVELADHANFGEFPSFAQNLHNESEDACQTDYGRSIVLPKGNGLEKPNLNAMAYAYMCSTLLLSLLMHQSNVYSVRKAQLIRL